MVLTPEGMKVYSLLIGHRQQRFSVPEILRYTAMTDKEFVSGLANLRTEIDGTHISLSVTGESDKAKETTYKLTSSRVGSEPLVHEELAFPGVKRFTEVV